MIHPFALIPILLPVFNPTTVAPPAATVAFTAPDPTLSAPLAPAVAEFIVTFPDPVVSSPLAPDVATVVIRAPDPERVSDNVLGVPTAELVFETPTPALVGPTIVRVDGATGLNFVAIDPTITYGYVTNEDEAAVFAVPLQSSREDLHRFQIAALANQTSRGKIACTGKMTLLANVAATYLRDGRLGPNSVVTFDPLTADALAEYLGGSMYAPAANRKEGQWLIQHANDASEDRSFRYSVVG